MALLNERDKYEQTFQTFSFDQKDAVLSQVENLRKSAKKSNQTYEKYPKEKKHNTEKLAEKIKHLLTGIFANED